MKNVLIYLCGILLFTQTATANTEIPVNNLTAPVRYAKAPLRFKTYSNYLKYVSIKAFKGADSANAFYKNEFEKTASNYIDYLPLTGGTLTGSLVGTDASFSGNALSVNGNNPALNITSSNATLYSYLNLSAGSASNQIFTLGQSYNSSGYLAAGAMVFIGTTTGVNIAATDASGVIRLYTGGANERVRIDNNGNVGIGTTSPGYKLDVNGTGNFSGNALSVNGNNPALNITSSNATLYSYLNLSAGSANNQIFTLGQSYTSNNIYDAGALVLAANTTGVNIGAIGGSGIIKLFTGGSNERMRIDASGFVGIGTTSPGAPLDISGSSRAYMQFNETGTGGRAYQILSTNNANSDAGGGKFAFRDPGVSGSAGYRIVIDNTGNVGVGTTNPDAGSKLHVAGGILVSGAFSSTSGNTGGFDYFGGGSRFFSMGTSGATKGTFTWIAKGADGSSTTSMIIDPNGNIGIGTITTLSEKLSVNGNISAKKLIVTQTGWSDYVFDKDYKLRSIQNLEAFINQNKHLPEVPTAKEVEANGISVGDNQALLLKKIEELTLYMIEMNKSNNQMKAEIKAQAKEIKQLKQVKK
ncbi:MAG: hypothetical protein M0Q26_10035 [Chitinophagaceae bacterium]|nr:hypothetical protein [Chitinophagaceae bacterium]